jgi:hypothetical protein
LVAAVPRGARRSEGTPAIVHAPAATQPSSRTGDDRAPSTGRASEDRPAVDRSENTADHNADNNTGAAADHAAPAAGPLGGLSRTLTHVVNGLG